ncbi:putative TGS-like domain superfamily protein [Helianthus anomalus]
MERRIEDLEKSMKRSNDKQLKVEHEVCLKVSLDDHVYQCMICLLTLCEVVFFCKLHFSSFMFIPDYNG